MLKADGRTLPLADGCVDFVLVESVAVFCDFSQLAREVWRVLCAGGTVGDNELTLRQAAPDELRSLLTSLFGISGRQEGEWRAAWEGAGFCSVASEVRPISLREQAAAHLEVDGLAGYLKGIRKGLAEKRLARAFLNRRMLRAALRFLPIVGYGLYAARKPRLG